ncbi:unnamed protein product, partial [Staurois parvus]
MRAHSFEWTPVPTTCRERSPCTSLENTACTGTSVSSTVAFSSAGGVPLELMAPPPAGPHSSVRVVRLHGFFFSDPQRHHPHRCEPRVTRDWDVFDSSV